MSDRRIGDCGHDTTQDYEWPGNGGRTICYRCFEIEADESWWAMFEALCDHPGSEHAKEPPSP